MTLTITLRIIGETYHLGFRSMFPLKERRSAKLRYWLRASYVTDERVFRAQRTWKYVALTWPMECWQLEPWLLTGWATEGDRGLKVSKTADIDEISKPRRPANVKASRLKPVPEDWLECLANACAGIANSFLTVAFHFQRIRP